MEVKGKCETKECIIKSSLFAHVDYSDPRVEPPYNDRI